MSKKTTKRYNFLYGQSYLLNLGIEFKFLDELESLFIVKSEKLGFLLRKKYRLQADGITDITEKIGFLFLAIDYIKRLEGKDQVRLIKYHFYNFVYDCKACLDSIAVVLNHQLKLGFKGGERDFRHWKFREALKTSSRFFKDFSKRFGKWCDNIVEYRDRIIHQVGVPVFQVGAGHPNETWKPSLPQCIPRQPISVYDISSGMKPDPIEIVSFCEKSIKKTMEIAGITMSEIYSNITEQRS